MSNNILYNAYNNFLQMERKKQFFRGKEFTKDHNKYQIIGFYDITLKLWYNAWGLSGTEGYKNFLNKSKQLLMYGIDIEKNSSLQHIERIIIRYIFTNPKLYICERKTQLYLILAIIIYFTKAKYYGRSTDENNIITYYIEL